MTPKQIRKVRRRFHDLVIAEALGKSAMGDRDKLKRYQALLRAKRSPAAISAEAKFEYEVRCIFKRLGASENSALHSTTFHA